MSHWKGPGRDEAPRGLCAFRVPGWLLTCIPLGAQGFAEGLAEGAAPHLLAVLFLMQDLAGVALKPSCVARGAQAKRHSPRSPQLTRGSESGLFTAETSFHSLFPLLFSADAHKASPARASLHASSGLQSQGLG